MIDPALHTGLIAAFEAAVNRALSLDPAAATRLEELDGKVFHLACTRPAIDVYVMPSDGRVLLRGFHDGDVTTSVRGTASDFGELATASDPAAALINGNIELEGDSGPLMDLQRIAQSLDLDWEAPLVDVLGDVIGHQVAQAIRGFARWGQQARSSIERQLDEFIHEEARLSPSRREVEDFYEDIELLGQRVDRLQARIRRLASRAAKRAEA